MTALHDDRHAAIERFAEGSTLFVEQIDLFDLGKLVQLCDEIPEELLLPVMKERQLPVMRKLVADAIGASL